MKIFFLIPTKENLGMKEKEKKKEKIQERKKKKKKNEGEKNLLQRKKKF